MKRKLAIIIGSLMIGVLAIIWSASGSIAYTPKNIGTITPGDANQDGAVNMGDITKIEREILGLDLLTYGADANQDGTINMSDVVRVSRIIMGLK